MRNKLSVRAGFKPASTLLTASLVLAMAFTISCSDDKDDDDKKKGGKGPVCYFKNSFGGLCYEGGTGLDKTICDAMTVYTWEASGSCPSGESAKCPSPFEGGMLYTYGEDYVDVCNPED